MAHDRQIYLLDPQQYSPETIAVAFAKTSRSPESFRQIAAELNAARSAEFNEKWVVGYGHSSVAEHAVLHIAVENISRLAVESLESNRLASYTEKSTRYQTWDADAFFIPPELTDRPLKDRFVQTCSHLFEVYQACLKAVLEHLKSTEAVLENESEAQYARRIRSRAVDACRYLLPAASLANVGVTINARELEHAISKMLTSPLQEVRESGAQIRDAARESIPTLLKYVSEIPYLQDVCNEFSQVSYSPPEKTSDWCTLQHYETQAIDRLLAAAIYRETEINYAQALDWVRAAPAKKKSAWLYCLLGDLDAHTIPARELEYVTFTFDIVMDQGAYYEFKRHRMMTQTPQRLTTRLGYAVPRVIQAAGALDLYQQAMDGAHETYLTLEALNPALASYVVPNGFNRRVLLTTNLRSLIHFIRLRTAPNAHFAVRRVAQRIAEQVAEVTPELQPYLGRNENETALTIEKTYFFETGT
jgi:thymidylate synthase ThyX